MDEPNDPSLIDKLSYRCALCANNFPTQMLWFNHVSLVHSDDFTCRRPKAVTSKSTDPNEEKAMSEEQIRLEFRNKNPKTYTRPSSNEVTTSSSSNRLLTMDDRENVKDEHQLTLDFLIEKYGSPAELSVNEEVDFLIEKKYNCNCCELKFNNLEEFQDHSCVNQDSTNESKIVKHPLKDDVSTEEGKRNLQNHIEKESKDVKVCCKSEDPEDDEVIEPTKFLAEFFEEEEEEFITGDIIHTKRDCSNSVLRKVRFKKRRKVFHNPYSCEPCDLTFPDFLSFKDHLAFHQDLLRL